MQSVAKHFGFGVDAPWSELAEEPRQAVLFGSGKDAVTFSYLTDSGGRTQRKHKFEGIVPNLERRYRATESSAVRAELPKYTSKPPCPACGAPRRTAAPANAFAADRPPPPLWALPP